MTPSAVCAARSVCPAGAGSKVVITIGPSVSACNRPSSALHAVRHHLVFFCCRRSLAPGRCNPAGAARLSLPRRTDSRCPASPPAVPRGMYAGAPAAGGRVVRTGGPQLGHQRVPCAQVGVQQRREWSVGAVQNGASPCPHCCRYCSQLVAALRPAALTLTLLNLCSLANLAEAMKLTRRLCRWVQQAALPHQPQPLCALAEPTHRRVCHAQLPAQQATLCFPPDSPPSPPLCAQCVAGHHWAGDCGAAARGV